MKLLGNLGSQISSITKSTNKNPTSSIAATKLIGSLVTSLYPTAICRPQNACRGGSGERPKSYLRTAKSVRWLANSLVAASKSICKGLTRNIQQTRLSGMGCLLFRKSRNAPRTHKSYSNLLRVESGILHCCLLSVLHKRESCHTLSQCHKTHPRIA